MVFFEFKGADYIRVVQCFIQNQKSDFLNFWVDSVIGKFPQSQTFSLQSNMASPGINIE